MKIYFETYSELIFNYSSEILVGTIASLVAAIITYFFSNQRAKFIESRLYGKFEGMWVERIENQPERIFSIATFGYDKKRRTYKYDGKNFNNDGSIYYKWNTVRIWHDRDTPRMLYIYEVVESLNPPKWKEGFGITNLDIKNKKFINGFFMDADKLGKPKDLRMIRIEELAEKMFFDLGDRSDNRLCNFIRRIVEIEKNTNTELF